MSKGTGVTDRLYYHGDDVSGDIASLSGLGNPRALLPATVINSSTEERMYGLADAHLAFNSYFNDDGAANRAAAAGSTFAVLSSLPSTDVALLYARGATIGNPCFAMTGKQVNYDPSRGADGSLLFSVDAQGSGAPGEWGELLTAGQHSFSSSAATAPTGVVAAAQTANGGVGFLQFQSRASGTPTFILEDSADTTNGIDGTWGTLLTFANTGAASSFGERKTVTGTVEKGVRCGTPTGTYTTAVIAVGFRRGTAYDTESLA